jgi:hypothetical protein
MFYFVIWSLTPKCNIDLCHRHLNFSHDNPPHFGGQLSQVIFKSLYVYRSYNGEWCFILLFDIWPLSLTLAFAIDTSILHATLCLTLEKICPCMYRSYDPDTGFALTPKCDLDLWAGNLGFTCDAPPHHEEHFYKINLFSFNKWVKYRPDKSGRTHIHLKIHQKWRLSRAHRKRAQQKSATIHCVDVNIMV